MLVNKSKLIELLDHENPHVRDESVKALDSFFKGSSGVIGPLINAICRYKNDSLSLVARVKSFIPNNGEIAELIRLFNETDPEETYSFFPNRSLLRDRSKAENYIQITE